MSIWSPRPPDEENIKSNLNKLIHCLHIYIYIYVYYTHTHSVSMM
jgi:hypothetical protein